MSARVGKEVMRVEMDELISGLQQLGFSQYESKAYVALLKNPRVSAYELARHSRIPPSKIYETVEKLVAKELVVAVEEGGGVRYDALEPEEVMGRYRSLYNRVLDSVGSNLKRVASAERGAPAYVWSLGHAEDIFSKAEEMVDAAQREVYVAVWSHELPRLLPALEAADARGVAIALCLYGPGDPGIGIVYHHPTDPVVLRDQGARRMVLACDDREALVGYFPEPGSASAHWSRNPGFVQMTKDYVRHDIWIIKVVARFEGPINEVFGDNREKLREVFHPDLPEVVAMRSKARTGVKSA
jgi:HTH-type transcriptional regulator, sugar sensing transcriptional regulator